MALHDLLATKQPEVIQRWAVLATREIMPAGVPPNELIDHIPSFLGEIVAALREASDTNGAGAAAQRTATAAGHGEQRLRLGFSLESVVREYGALRDAIVATARASELAVTFVELQIIHDLIITGIADAISEYTRQRDAELQRLANEQYAFIAHELRSPLSSARMAFDVLSSKKKIAPEEERLIAVLDRSLRRAGDLIDQTLTVARVASGIDIRRETTRLSVLLGEAELGSIVEAEVKGVTVKVKITQDEPAQLDPRLVFSAVTNLVRNAVKYTPSGGTVEIRGEATKEHVTIEVEDCCGGLPPGKVEEAFAPFVRLDERQSGFGLGLAIAKQAVDAHGGSIRINNLPGKGCIFVLDLPSLGPSARV